MKMFYLRLFVFAFALAFTALLWWRADPVDDVPFRTSTASYQSSIRGADWQALIAPRVLSVSPIDQAEDVLIGIEDPIVVTFESSVKPFFIDFALDPPAEVIYENNPEKTEFRLLPKTPLRDGTAYALTVAYRSEGQADATPIQIHRSSFQTLAAAPDTWNADLDVRLAEARKFTRPLIGQGKYIDINLKSQVMTIFEDGHLADAFIVSSGLPGMDTPQGEFAIQNRAERVWSKRYSLYMPYWMAITPDGKYGIHELPEWPGGYKEGANHLGRPVSHGCVRLGVGAAARVYGWADIGTRVIVH